MQQLAKILIEFFLFSFLEPYPVPGGNVEANEESEPENDDEDEYEWVIVFPPQEHGGKFDEIGHTLFTFCTCICIFNLQFQEHQNQSNAILLIILWFKPLIVLLNEIKQYLFYSFYFIEEEGAEDEEFEGTDDDEHESDYNVPLPDPLTPEVVQQKAASIIPAALGRIFFKLDSIFLF